MDRPALQSLTAVALVLLSACGRTAEPAAEEPPEAVARQAEVLRSLPYAGWAPLGGDEAPPSGVVHHDRERAFGGLNLFSPRELAAGFLMDMEGRIVHRWAAAAPAEAIHASGWQHVELARGGDLLVIVKDAALLRLDRRSELRRALSGRFHHDLAEADNGDLYTFVRRDRMVTLHGIEVPVLDDLIVLVAGGEIRREISLFELFPDRFSRKHVEMIRRQSVERGYYEAMAAPRTADQAVIPGDAHGDLFHLNSVEILGRDLAGLGKAGDLLISIRNMNTVAIFDPEALEVRWSWGPGELEWQHHPTLLENGRILIFDNGVVREYSRLLEIDPASGEIVWEYRADPPATFYSRSRGASQRLPGGNTLVTESDAGRVFELDPDGRVVWDYYCDLIRGDGDRRERSTIYRLERITDPERFGVADLAGRRSD